MAIQKEIWQNLIIEKLYAANPHLNLCTNADQYVLAGKVVHIPQAGAAPAVQKNRGILPATVTKRTDTDVTYALDEYTSDPVHIPNADKCELSYDKSASVLADTNMALGETVAVSLIHRWLPKEPSRLIRTTGAVVAAHIEGATGNRKAITLSDLKRAQKQFNKDNVPTEGRYIMLDADMYDQFTEQLSVTQERDFSRAIDEKTGIVGKLYGFNFLQRSHVAAYDNETPLDPDTEAKATDCAAALCWHVGSVERALGDVKFFEDEGNPTYYGDIYSGLVRLGGRIRRSDCKGVVAIVQQIAGVGE